MAEVATGAEAGLTSTEVSVGSTVTETELVATPPSASLSVTVSAYAPALLKVATALFAALEPLAENATKAGPIDDKTAALVKLAIAVGTRHEGAVHSHTRRSIEAGASIDECRHVVLLSLTTIGFPAMMAALSWVEDVAKDAS